MTRPRTDGLRGLRRLVPEPETLHPKVLAAIGDEYNRLAATESAITTLRGEVRQHVNTGTSDMERLANVGLYVCLFLRDQSFLKLAWLTKRAPSHRSHIARSWVTLLWDVADKMRPAQEMTNLATADRDRGRYATTTRG